MILSPSYGNALTKQDTLSWLTIVSILPISYAICSSYSLAKHLRCQTRSIKTQLHKALHMYLQTWFKSLNKTTGIFLHSRCNHPPTFLIYRHIELHQAYSSYETNFGITINHTGINPISCDARSLASFAMLPGKDLQ